MLRHTLVILGATSLFLGCRAKKGGNEVVPLTATKLARTSDQVAVGGSQTELQSKALKLFEEQCYACHGQNGSNSGNIGDIRNIESLSEKGLIRLGTPADQNKLYQRMTSKTQPMPPKGILDQASLNVVKAWIEKVPEARQLVSYESVYKAIESDFNKFKPEDKINIRYFHLVNKFNSGAPEESIEQTRKALSKMLNMLSTSVSIVKPEPIDTLRLVYRVNLKDYDLHRPETLYTRMLKVIYPSMTPEQREKWLPNPADADARGFYGARYKEIFEGKKSESKFLDADAHTFKEGLPFAKHPILTKMAREMREAGQRLEPTAASTFGIVPQAEINDTLRCQAEEKPADLSCSNPLPLVRADWFVSQVAGNMRMRIYYHAAGMDDDTVTLDVALGIDDAEANMIDNDPDFKEDSVPKDQRIIRAGFNNSGVSINHRSFERIPLNYFPGKPLWRAYEFKDKLKPQYNRHDIFRYATGPVLESGDDDDAGFECINFMTDRFTVVRDGPRAGEKVRTMALLDHGVLYPSLLPNGGTPKIVRELMAIRSRESDPQPTGNKKYDELLSNFYELYGHKDYFRWKADEYERKFGSLPVISQEGNPFKGTRKIRCELEQSNPTAFRHDSLEYLFLKPNGMQAFVNVGLKAEHLDYKIPNQRALENKEALLIPAHDRNELLVVGAPLSCLSCHTQGFIEKEDQVSKYIESAPRPQNIGEEFWEKLKRKISSYHVPFDELKAQMSKDNDVFRNALNSAGINYKDPEPIVDTYRNWAIPGMTFAQVAEDLEVSQQKLREFMKTNAEVGDLLREFNIPNATIRRAEFEKAYRKLMCTIHGSCKKTDLQNIIPHQ